MGHIRRLAALFPELAAAARHRARLERPQAVEVFAGLAAAVAAVEDGWRVLIHGQDLRRHSDRMPELIRLAMRGAPFRVIVMFERSPLMIEKVIARALTPAGILYVPDDIPESGRKLLVEWAEAAQSPLKPGPVELLASLLVLPELPRLAREFMGVAVACPCGLSVPQAAKLCGTKERTLQQELKNAGLRPPEFWLRACEAWTAGWWAGPQARPLDWAAQVLGLRSHKTVSWRLGHYAKATANGLRRPGEYLRRLERFAIAEVWRAVASDRIRYQVPAQIAPNDEEHRRAVRHVTTGRSHALTFPEQFAWDMLRAGAAEAEVIRAFHREGILPLEYHLAMGRAVIDRLVDDELLEPDLWPPTRGLVT